MIPTAKWTAQTITTLLVAIIADIALIIFETPLDAGTREALAGVIGWAVGAAWAWLRPETRPAPSSIPYLPREVFPSERHRG